VGTRRLGSKPSKRALKLEFTGAANVRTISVAVCLFVSAILSGAWNSNQVKESAKMSQATNSVRFVKSETLPPSQGYSQAVEILPGARIVYVAGQVALDRSGKLVGEGDLRAQATQTFENLKAALQASGASLENVVKLNSYFMDISQLPTFREVRDKYIHLANPPASTAVEVKRLFREGFLIEIEAVAVVPE
jgi:reactive intermediate/imine deaminase